MESLVLSPISTNQGSIRFYFLPGKCPVVRQSAITWSATLRKSAWLPALPQRKVTFSEMTHCLLVTSFPALFCLQEPPILHSSSALLSTCEKECCPTYESFSQLNLQMNGGGSERVIPRWATLACRLFQAEDNWGPSAQEEPLPSPVSLPKRI